MATGEEIDPALRDAFGDPLIELDDNWREIDEMVARDNDIARHGFDHEWCMSNERSAIAPIAGMDMLRCCRVSRSRRAFLAASCASSPLPSGRAERAVIATYTRAIRSNKRRCR